MQKEAYSQLFLLVVFLLVVIPTLASAQTTVKLLSITETRHKDMPSLEKSLGGDSSTFYIHTIPTLTLTIEVQGEVVANATKYGFVTINSAKDNTGKELKQISQESFYGSESPTTSFVNIDRQRMYQNMYVSMNEISVPMDRIMLTINLDVPARAAEQITLIDGSLKLLTGESSEVIVDSVLTKVSTSIQHSLFQECGVQAKIVSLEESGMFGFNSDDASKTVGVQLTGKLDAVLKLKLTDDSGNKLNSGITWMGSDTRKTYLLESEEPLPENTKLVIVLAKGEKTLDVPFKFHNIILP